MYKQVLVHTLTKKKITTSSFSSREHLELSGKNMGENYQGGDGTGSCILLLCIAYRYSA